MLVLPDLKQCCAWSEKKTVRKRSDPCIQGARRRSFLYRVSPSFPGPTRRQPAELRHRGRPRPHALPAPAVPRQDCRGHRSRLWRKPCNYLQKRHHKTYVRICTIYKCLWVIWGMFRVLPDLFMVPLCTCVCCRYFGQLYGFPQAPEARGAGSASRRLRLGPGGGQTSPCP